MKTKNYSKTQLTASILAVLLLAIAGMAASGPQVIAPGAPAPDFTLKDQFDHDTKLSDYKGQNVLIIAWDRTGNDYMSNWMTAVRKQYPGGPNRVVTLVFVASYKGAPGFLQDNIKRKFQKTPDGRNNGPILLDWNGTFAKAYGFQSDLTNVYLIDAKGTFRYWGYGKGQAQEELQPLLREIGNAASTQQKASNPTEPRR